MLYIKLILKSFAISCLICVPAALANEGSLTTPTQITDAVELRLSKNIVDNYRKNYAKLLQVFYVGKTDECCEDKTPMSGHYEVFDSGIKFTPIFDFVAEQNYVIQYRDGNNNASYKYTTFNIHSHIAPKIPRVTKIYPSDDKIPENTLRFYIHFSTPMEPHVAFEHIKLIDAKGNIDDAAFMKFKQELWSEDRKRLTILLDPGRIKRGVATNMELGPALIEGKHYILTIDKNWRSALGKSLNQSFTKSIEIVQPIRKRINPEQWQLSAPRIHTMDALTIKFDRVMDHALTKRMISLRSERGRIKDGISQLLNNERTWSFIPAQPWTGENIYLDIQTELEDISGNNLRDSLDHKLGEKTLPKKILTKTIKLR